MGHKVLAGQKKIELDKKTTVRDVRQFSDMRVIVFHGIQAD